MYSCKKKHLPISLLVTTFLKSIKEVQEVHKYIAVGFAS
jgi:hypothetical protein